MLSRVVARGVPVVAIVLACLPPPAGAEFYGHVAASSVEESNVNGGAPAQSDSRQALRATAGVRLDMGATGRLTLQADGERERHAHFRGLDNDALALSARYRHPIGFGPVAPWLVLRAGIGRRDYDDDPRDTTRVTAGVGLGMPLGPGAELEARYDHARERADAAVFDTARDEISLEGRAWPTRWLSGWVRVGAATGTSTLTAASDPALASAASDSASDPVFGAGFTAYRFDSRERSAGGGLRIELGRAGAVELSLRRVIVRADGADTYASTLRSAGWSLHW